MTFGPIMQTQTMAKKQSCVILIQTIPLHTSKHYIYKDTAVVETKSDTSNYELDKPLPNEKKLKVIGLRWIWTKMN